MPCARPSAILPDQSAEFSEFSVQPTLNSASRVFAPIPAYELGKERRQACGIAARPCETRHASNADRGAMVTEHDRYVAAKKTAPWISAPVLPLRPGSPSVVSSALLYI